MNITEIRELAQIMSEYSLNEINLEENGTKIQLSKTIQQVTNAIVQVPQISAQEEVNTVKLEGEIIKSPTVGIFYSSPSPDEESYISIGSKVNVGDVVCIIEAMKLMNEIQADAQGEVVEILVGNGQVVEYDQPLFRLK